MTPTQIVEQALALAEARLAQSPAFVLYQSIHAQLGYLLGVVTGAECDRIRLKDINFGVYAAREFETSDPDFAEALHPAYWIASQMAKGLKVPDLPN